MQNSASYRWIYFTNTQKQQFQYINTIKLKWQERSFTKAETKGSHKA